jgi:threonine dehydratase
VERPVGGIAADSLAPRFIGTLMFPIAQRHIERVVLVADDDIRAAQRTLWDRLRVVAEPGRHRGLVRAALAALPSGARRARRLSC